MEIPNELLRFADCMMMIGSRLEEAVNPYSILLLLSETLQTGQKYGSVKIEIDERTFPAGSKNCLLTFVNIFIPPMYNRQIIAIRS